MRRNGSPVPLHGTRVQVLRGKLNCPRRIRLFNIPIAASHDGRVAAELTTEYGRITIPNIGCYGAHCKTGAIEASNRGGF